MKNRPFLSISLLGTALIALAALLLLMTGAAIANPPLQNGSDFATPTLSPVDIDLADFPVTEVGGSYETLSYPGETIGDFRIIGTEAVSNYPKGASFVLEVESELEIARVTLFARYLFGSGVRAIAQPVEGSDTLWEALLYDTPGQPPWQEFEFYWSITADNNDFAETTPQAFVYSDPTRVWYKSDSPLLRVYWFGGEQEFGEIAQYAIYAVRERHEIGFGGGLSYTPIAVIFPDLESFAEFQSGGVEGVRGRAGFTSNSLGMTVQRFIGTGFASSCPIYPRPEEQTTEWLYRYTAGVITHEVTHLYQYDYNINGPTWFMEGAATWFSMEPFRGREEGLRLRDSDDDLPTLQGVGPSSSAYTPAGCNALSYWMGTSFFNYIYGAYGLEAIGMWHDAIGRNRTMNDALVAATGKTLAELEREWRIYLGLTPDVYVRPTDPYQFPATATPFGGGS